MKTKIEIVREITKAAGSSMCGALWVKKTTGEIRRATWNPRDFNDIKGTGKEKDPKSSIYCFRESQCKTDPDRKPRWRSFDAEWLLLLTSKGKTWDFTGEEVKEIDLELADAESHDVENFIEFALELAESVR